MGFFARVGRFFRGFIGLFISGLEESNPEILLEAAKQDFHGKLVKYNNALARLAGIAESLKAQIKGKTQKVQMLTQRVLANNAAGNAELAGSLAREFQEIKADLTHDTQELTETEQAYQANVENAKVARKEFDEKLRSLERQLSQVKVKEAQAEAAAALSGVAFNIADVGDTLKNAEEVLQKRYEKAAGKARVTMDMTDSSAAREKETERKALEQQALAEFLADNNVRVAPKEEAPSAQKKVMGPQAQ
jgi:phage shock protein A